MSRKNSWVFSDISEALRKSVGFAYTLRRKNKGKDVPYEGPELTAGRVLACSFTVEEAFSEEQLRYDREDQGRDAMEVILGKAIQLGMEQGWRMLMDDASTLDLKVIRRALECDDKALRRRALECLSSLEERLTNPGMIG